MTNYNYDLLERTIQRTNSDGTQTTEAYDVMGNTILNKTQDLLEPDNIAPDFQRNTQAQYDGWNQAIKNSQSLYWRFISGSQNPR